MKNSKKQVIIIGNGMTALRFCERMQEYDARSEWDITVIGAESLPAYDRVNLSSLFEPDLSKKDLILAEKRWYRHHGIKLHLKTRVTGIDREQKTVRTEDGRDLAYDRLVLATGSRAHRPALPGVDRAGVEVYRTPDDIRSIETHADSADHAVILGGGLLGLEAAEVCARRGLHTTVLEREPHLMALQLGRHGGTLLREKVEAHGIHVMTDVQVVELAGSDRVESVRLQDDRTLPAQLLILAAGIVPNDDLARTAGLKVGSSGGVAVDGHMQTSDPDIYAIGECAAFRDRTFGLIAPCYDMAETAAAGFGGINRTFSLHAPAAQLKMFDLQVASLGHPQAEGPAIRRFIQEDASAGVYKKLVVDTANGRLRGAVLMGETSEFERLRTRMDDEAVAPSDPLEWLAPVGQLLEPGPELADDDVVCYCNYVTKGDIARVIRRDGLTTTAEVMGTTYAAGLCGSCLDTVDAVTRQEVAYAAREEEDAGSG